MKFIKNKKRLFALITTVALLAAMVITGTLAQLNRASDELAWTDFANPHHQAMELSTLRATLDVAPEAGTLPATRTRFLAGATRWAVSDPTILSIPANTNDATFAMATALRPGFASFAAGTVAGELSPEALQVIDSRNIERIGVPVGHSMDVARAATNVSIPVDARTRQGLDVANSGNHQISWTSVNEDVVTIVEGAANVADLLNVADVNTTTMIIGTFTDIWGVSQTVPLLVNIGPERVHIERIYVPGEGYRYFVNVYVTVDGERIYVEVESDGTPQYPARYYVIRDNEIIREVFVDRDGDFVDEDPRVYIVRIYVGDAYRYYIHVGYTSEGERVYVRVYSDGTPMHPARYYVIQDREVIREVFVDRDNDFVDDTVIRYTIFRYYVAGEGYRYFIHIGNDYYLEVEADGSHRVPPRVFERDRDAGTMTLVDCDCVIYDCNHLPHYKYVDGYYFIRTDANYNGNQIWMLLHGRDTEHEGSVVMGPHYYIFDPDRRPVWPDNGGWTDEEPAHWEISINNHPDTMLQGVGGAVPFAATVLRNGVEVAQGVSGNVTWSVYPALTGNSIGANGVFTVTRGLETFTITATHPEAGAVTTQISVRLPSMDTVIGQRTFSDRNGVVWRVLRDDAQGTLIIREHITAPIYQWNTVDEFGSPTPLGSANNALTTLWNATGSDVRSLARNVNLGVDVRTEVSSFLDIESIRPDAVGELNIVTELGMSWPGASIQAGQNGLFHLSVREAFYYTTNNGSRIGREVETNSAHTWWLRSPGNSALQFQASGIGAAGNVVSVGASQARSIRPALWITPPTP